jgi:beta-lactamase class A
MLFSVVVVCATIGLHFFILPHKLSAQSKSSTQTTTAPTVVTPPVSAAAIQTMSSKITSLISAAPTVDTTVTLTDLDTNKSYNFGPAVPYVAASIGKLVTAAAYLHGVETGSQSLQTTLDSGNSASTDMRQMIVNSDNTSWQALNDQLGTTALGNYAVSIGITDYDLDNNTLTTTDIAGLLQKLYDGTLLNKTDTSLLLSYMKIANEAYYIVPVIPKDVTVYHKAGLLDDRIHDAAIIDNGKHRLVLVIFTNGHGTYDDTARTTLIQSITKAVLAAYTIT